MRAVLWAKWAVLGLLLAGIGEAQTISSVTRANDPQCPVYVGNNDVLIVTGTGFISSSVVQWNGTALATNTSGAPAGLTASLPGSLITAPGTYSVTVTNPGAGTSPPFNVTAARLTIASLSPTSVPAGSAGLTLNVNGSGFCSGSPFSGSLLFFGGAQIGIGSVPGESVVVASGNLLTATIGAARVASPGSVQVQVANTFGPASNLVPFLISNPNISVSVDPLDVVLTAGQTQQFSATVSGTENTAVTWSINPNVGSISANGLYTAPSLIPNQRAVTVTATSSDDPTKSASAAVRLIPVTVAVSPRAVTLTAGLTQQFSATVSGSSNSAVTWSISPDVGSIFSSGLYFAPNSIASRQTITVTATSVADPTKSGTATVTLNPTVSVTVSPPSAVLNAGQTQQFSATVSGTSNSSVTWSLSPTVGTISASGLYTAPSFIASPKTITVTATSAADPTKSGTATVTLNPTVSVTVSPPSAVLNAGQTQQFSATVSGTSNSSVTWSLSPSVGTISASGLYTAPSFIASPQTITVTATSVADPTKSGTATVTLNPTVSVSVNPPSVVLTAGQTQQFSATVSGTSNTAVTWSLSPNVGTISTSGLYTAPSAIASQQIVTVTATSVADSTKSAAASVTLVPVSVTVSPSNVTMEAGQTQLFSVVVTGTSNTSVTWSISPNVGTISSIGLYAAPALVSSRQVVTVTATSAADPSKSGTATVTLNPVSITVDPHSATLRAGESQQFNATVTGTANTAVTWSIQPGTGTISNSGLYTAPGNIAAPLVVLVVAASVADPTKFAFATVKLNPPVTVTVSPPTAAVLAGQSQQFRAAVTGTGNTAVVWTISPIAGSISSSGLYTAPSEVSAPDTVTVTATSVADPTQSSTAKLTLSTTLGISVSPVSVGLASGESQQFSATVTGSSDTAVTWTVTPNVGAISASGLYTAPSPITRQQVVTVTARSTADSTKTATATVTLNPTVAITVSPPGATLTAGESQEFTAAVTGTTNTAVIWTINPAVGSISIAGVYTAPGFIATQQTVTVTATSVADSTKAATAAVTLNPTITVTVSPPEATLTAGQSRQFTAAVAGTSNTAVTWEITPNVGTISDTGLYTAPAVIAAQQVVTVRATSVADSTRSGTATVTINPPVTVSVTPPAVTLSAGESQQFSATVTGSANNAVVWSISPNTGTISTGGLYTAPSPVATQQTVTVTATSVADSSKSATASVVLLVTIPAVSLTGLDSTSDPTQSVSVGIGLDAPAPVPLEGTLTLSFRPALPGLPAGYIDPAAQFMSGGTSIDFTIPAGATTIVLPQSGVIQQGTVAGDLTVALTRLVSGGRNVLPSNPPSRTVSVPRLAPVITPNSVRFVNVTGTGFKIELLAYSTTRELTTASFVFTAASGAQLEGSTSFSVNLAAATSAWFASAEGLASGGAFRLQVPFTLSGDAGVLQGVTVTLSNSVGPSAPASGTR